jgi:hypothetical protein
MHSTLPPDPLAPLVGVEPAEPAEPPVTVPVPPVPAVPPLVVPLFPSPASGTAGAELHAEAAKSPRQASANWHESERFGAGRIGSLVMLHPRPSITRFRLPLEKSRETIGHPSTDEFDDGFRFAPTKITI